MKNDFLKQEYIIFLYICKCRGKNNFKYVRMHKLHYFKADVKPIIEINLKACGFTG